MIRLLPALHGRPGSLLDWGWVPEAFVPVVSLARATCLSGRHPTDSRFQKEHWPGSGVSMVACSLYRAGATDERAPGWLMDGDWERMRWMEARESQTGRVMCNQ